MTDIIQWQRDNPAGSATGATDISGATGSSYTYTVSDTGHKVRARDSGDATVAASPWSAVITNPAPPPSGLPKQGISSPEFVSRSAADQDYELARVAELGNGHTMFFRFDWFPSPSSTYTAAKTKIEALGIVPMPLINYDPGGRPSVAAYASQAAQCAGQGFKYINLLNEPNLGGWTPQDAAAYTKAGYDAIKAVNPNAVVLCPDVAANGGHPPTTVVSWLQAYIAAGGKQDIGAANLYGDAVQLDPSWNLWAEVPQLKAAFGSIPIASLEGGCQVDSNGTLLSYSTGPWGHITGDQYQLHCVQTAMAACAAGTIDCYLVYTVLNQFVHAAGGFGLVDSSRVKRPAYATFQAGAR